MPRKQILADPDFPELPLSLAQTSRVQRHISGRRKRGRKYIPRLEEAEKLREWARTEDLKKQSFTV